MAGFNAEKLGERLDALNRDKLAALEKLSEELLAEAQRNGPIRVGDSESAVSEGTGAKKRRARP